MVFATATNTSMASDLVTLTRIRIMFAKGQPGTPDRADPNMVFFKTIRSILRPYLSS